MFDGKAGVMRAEVHRATCVYIVWLRDDTPIVGAQEPPRLSRKAGGETIAFRCDVGLHGVRDGIEACSRRDRRRLRDRQGLGREWPTRNAAFGSPQAFFTRVAASETTA